MTEHTNFLIEKYRTKGILIDTNLLLLFVVGKHDKFLIEKFKRVQQFTIEDYEFICGFVRYFSKVIVTPYILTEVSNLLNQLPEQYKFEQYSAFSHLMQEWLERHTESKLIATVESFKKYGLTDAEIAETGLKKDHLILTDDFRLTGFLNKQGIDVINFNNIRMMNWK